MMRRGEPGRRATVLRSPCPAVDVLLDAITGVGSNPADLAPTGAADTGGCMHPHPVLLPNSQSADP